MLWGILFYLLCSYDSYCVMFGVAITNRFFFIFRGSTVLKSNYRRNAYTLFNFKGAQLTHIFFTIRNEGNENWFVLLRRNYYIFSRVFIF